MLVDTFHCSYRTGYRTATTSLRFQKPLSSMTSWGAAKISILGRKYWEIASGSKHSSCSTVTNPAMRKGRNQTNMIRQRSRDDEVTPSLPIRIMYAILSRWLTSRFSHKSKKMGGLPLSMTSPRCNYARRLQMKSPVHILFAARSK